MSFEPKGTDSTVTLDANGDRPGGGVGCSCGCSPPDASATEDACPIGEVFSTDKCACVTDEERIGANLIEHGTPEGIDNKDVMVEGGESSMDNFNNSAVPDFQVKNLILRVNKVFGGGG